MPLSIAQDKQDFHPAGTAKTKEASEDKEAARSNFKLKFKVLGVKVMDADVAILSATAVTRSRKKGVKILALLVPVLVKLNSQKYLGLLPLPIRVESNAVNWPKMAFDSSKLFLDAQVEISRTISKIQRDRHH